MATIPGYNIEIPSSENIAVMKEQCDYLYDIQGNLKSSADSIEYALNNERYSAWFLQTQEGQNIRKKVLDNCQKLRQLDSQVSGIYQTIESLIYFCERQ